MKLKSSAILLLSLGLGTACMALQEDTKSLPPEDDAALTTSPVQEAQELPASEKPVVEEAPAENKSAVRSPFTCPTGEWTAPAGQLTAKRIAAAEPAADDKDWFLYEGALWFDDALYFSRFGDKDNASVMLKLQDGVMTQVNGVTGTNGLATDGTYIYAATFTPGNITRYDSKMKAQDLVSSVEEKSFLSPNDLAVSKLGAVYFSDPDFQKDRGTGDAPQTDKTRVYALMPDGELISVDDSIKNPNGVTLSPDEKTLYVAGGLDKGYIKAYPLDDDGRPQAGKIWADPKTVLDGMVSDCLGNLYVTEHMNAKVMVYSPAGKKIATILREGKGNVTNVAFGGKDSKTLFITGERGVWSVELDTAGFPY